MIGQLLLAFISTFAFAILFSAPRSQYFACGLCGCFTWGMYLLFQKFGNSVVIAALFATFFVIRFSKNTFYYKKSSRYYLSGNRNPSFSSGSGIYYTSYHLIMITAEWLPLWGWKLSRWQVLLHWALSSVLRYR